MIKINIFSPAKYISPTYISTADLWLESQHIKNSFKLDLRRELTLSRHKL